MKVFYFSALLFFSAISYGQSPGGISGSVLWLKANSGVNVGAGTWTDYSPINNSFAQPNSGFMPSKGLSVFNFNPAVVFDGNSSNFMYLLNPIGFPEGNANRSIYVVAKAAEFRGYRWIFTYGNPGTNNGTCQMGNKNAALVNAYFNLSDPNPDFETPQFADLDADPPGSHYWDQPTNLNGALAGFILNGKDQIHYDRGFALDGSSIDPSLDLLAASQNAMIGGLDPTDVSGAPNFTPKEFWTGSIGEVMMFDKALSDPERQQVESYLALKYGFTIGSSGLPMEYIASDATTIFWSNPDGLYHNDVFGIGTDAGSGLTVTQSNSINSGSGDGTGQSGLGNIVLSTATPLGDGQFLMIGNDAGPLDESTVTSNVPTLVEGSKIVGRNWRVQNTNFAFPDDLAISFDVDGLSYTGGMTASNYRLMIDPNGDGDYTDGRLMKPTGFNGTRLTFGGASDPVILGNNVTFTIITQGSAALLPATWQGFNVAQQANNAYLTWKTSEEVDVDYYTVEFSVNGTSFFSAGNVAARNSGGSAVNTYTFSQQNLPAGVRYYRIKRVDKNGQVGYTDTKSIRIGAQTSLILKSNPVTTGKLELNIDVAQNQTAEIRVVNTSGQIVLQQKVGLTNGSNSVLSNISSLTPGSYFLQVQLSNEILNRKFVKAH